MSSTQRCGRCLEDKALDDFHPSKRASSGPWRPWCRSCCTTHKRERRAAERATRPPRERKPPMGTDYRSTRARILILRGQANEHTCPCGEQASRWTYQHTDPLPLIGTTCHGTQVRYSPDPVHYLPMCRSCEDRVRRQHLTSATL